MNVHHESAHRHANIDDSHLDAQVDEGRVESSETRILLDGSPHRCESCDGVIDVQDRYRCLTVRDDAGRVSELDFCGEDCVSAQLRGERYRAGAQ